jgi:hypothetical protein
VQGIYGQAGGVMGIYNTGLPPHYVGAARSRVSQHFDD